MGHNQSRSQTFQPTLRPWGQKLRRPWKSTSGGGAAEEGPDPNRAQVVAAVWAEVGDRQRQSLHAAVGQTTISPTATPVSPLWHGTFTDGLAPSRAAVPASPNSPQPPLAEIIAALDHPATAGQLRITGASGLGKTTLLVELAAELVQRAQRDSQAPIPVLVHLSGQAEAGTPGQEGLVVALRRKYGIAPKLAQHWLNQGHLVPLLDGWDDLPPSIQAEWAVWVQAWLRAGRSLILAGSGPPLRTTLALQPLTEGQIKTFLTHLGREDAWQAVQAHPERVALIRTPLLLGLALLTTGERAWPTSAEALMDHFLDQQSHRLQDLQRCRPGQSRHENPSPLRVFTRMAQTAPWGEDLWLETMQPSLLQGTAQHWGYRILGGLLFGLAGGSIFGLLVGRFSGLLALAVIAFMFMLLRGSSPIDTDTGVCPDPSTLLRFLAVRQINFILVIGLATGFGVLITSRSMVGGLIGLIIGFLVGFAVRLMIVLPGGLLGGIIYGVHRMLEEDIAARQRLNHGILVRLEYSLGLVALFLGGWLLLRGLLLGLLPWIALDVARQLSPFVPIADLTLALVLWANIFQSSLTCAQHGALRLVLYASGAMPWNLARALATGRDIHLVQQVGGHYRFIHPQVQARLAAGPLRAPPQNPNLSIPSPKS